MVGLNPADFCFMLFSDHNGKTAAKKFAIGAVDKMAETAAAWSAEPDRQVYCAPVLYHRLRVARGSRGKEEDIAFVLGSGGDVDHDHSQDHRVVGTLKPKPTFTLVTSRCRDLPNLCPMFLYNRPLTPDEAKPIAAGLNAVIEDGEGSTARINQPWRLPGTLNWISKAKAERRKLPWPCPPQLVTVDPDLGSGLLVDPAALSDFLDIEAEGRAPVAPRSHPLDPDDRLAVGREIWNGDERENRRLIAALLHIDRQEQAKRAAGQTIELRGRQHDIRTRTSWLWLGMALHIWHLGSESGFELWRSVSAGDPERGFVGAPEKWDERDACRVWASFSEPVVKDAKAVRVVTVGSVFELASALGFDTRRGRYNLGQLPGRTIVPCAEAQRVREAGLAYHSLADRGGRDIRSEGREALRRYAERHSNRRREARVLNLIMCDLHHDSTSGYPVGCAWRGVPAYCAELSDGGAKWDHRDLWREIDRLKRCGYLVASPANKIGAHGERGASYAITPPPGVTWESLIEDFRVRRSHTSATAHVPAPASFKIHPPLRSHRDETMRRGHPSLRSHVGETYTRLISTTPSSLSTDTQHDVTHEPISRANGQDPTAPGRDVHAAVSPTKADQTTTPAAGRPLPDLADWLASGDLPPAMAHALRQVAMGKSKRPDEIMAKLNKLVTAGLTPGSVSHELHEIELRLSWRGKDHALADLIQEEPGKLITKFFEAVTLLVGDHGIDVGDADMVRRRRDAVAARVRASTTPTSGGTRTVTTPPVPEAQRAAPGASVNVVDFAAYRHLGSKPA